jgi:imidazole glycerol phosphate synthase glutamine amidotransferase subunit
MIHLIDDGVSGLHGMEGALDRLGFEHRRTQRPEPARPGDLLILAPAGPLDTVTAALRERGWWRELPHLVAEGRSLLGVGMGLHLLAEESEESPKGAGLGMIPGIVRRLGPGVKVPHMGWARVSRHNPHPTFPDPREGWLYFMHAYALEPTSETLAVATHGRPFSVVEVRGRVIGVQARTEKSGAFGLVLLEKILVWLGQKARQVPDIPCN